MVIMAMIIIDIVVNLAACVDIQDFYLMCILLY